jgi:outer membrane receptor protein involved in Fe transport
MAQALPPELASQRVIVVTGKALPDPAAARAYDVETIGRKQLQNAPSHQIEDILQQIPGLQLYRRSDATSAHPTSQGVTLRALGGNASSRALLLLDGVPQADPFGGWVDWRAYDPTTIQQVRVIRGGGSVSYGPGALAGVIDMSSRAGVAEDGEVDVGSRNSLDASVFDAADLGGGLLTLSGQGGRSDGFVPITAATRGPVDRASPYDEASLRTRWVAAIARNTELQLSGFGFVDRRDRGVPFTANRTRGTDFSLRLVGSGSWQWSVLAYGQWRDFRSSFASVNRGRTDATRVSLQDSVPAQGYGGSLEVRPPLGPDVQLRIGADERSTNGESKEFYNYVSGEPTRRRMAGGSSQTEGLFSEASWIRGPLTISGGARLDHWRISNGKLLEWLLSSGQLTRNDGYAAREGWLPTVRAAAVLQARDGVSLRSAAYLGWRLPTLNELFRPFRAGSDATAANPFLKPERLAGAEIGVEYQRGMISASVTAFANRLSDAIANVTLGHGPGLFPGVGFVAGSYQQRENIRAIKVRGIEASLEARQGPWSIRLGASDTDARVVADGAAAQLNGLRPAQTPRLIVTGAVAWESRGRSVDVELRRMGSQFEDDLNLRRIRPATVVDASVAWPLAKGAQLVLRGENLLDETVIAGLNSDGSVERATPRTLWVGVRFGLSN